MKQQIENLYKTFQAYRSAEIDSSPPYHRWAEIKKLPTIALRDATWDDFGSYVFKAMTTMADLKTYKHYLPRIFELFVLDFGNAHYDVGLLFSKLEYGEWRSWPPEEYSAVKQAIDAWIHELESSEDPDSAAVLEEIREDMQTYGFSFKLDTDTNGQTHE